MRGPRLLACLFGGFVLFFVGVMYLQFIHLSGFPDSYRTDLDIAQTRLFSAFCVAGLVIGAYSFHLAWSESVENPQRQLMMAVLSFVVLAIIVFSLSVSFSGSLDHGGGG
jgi:hypothetical protein